MKRYYLDTSTYTTGSTFFTVSLAIYPILSMYGFSLISIGDIILILSLVSSYRPNNDLVVVNRRPIRFQWLFLTYCVISVIIALLTKKNVLFGSMAKRVIKQGFYISVISCCPKMLNRKLFIRIYRGVVYVAFAGLVIQYAAYYGLGRVIVPRIPFLPYSGVTTEERILRSLSLQFRPGSFFSEPAACSYVLLPYLSFALLKQQDGGKKRYYDIAILTASVLMTQSSAGLICCLIIYVAYFARIIMTSSLSVEKKITRIIVFLLLVATGYYVYINSTLRFSLERIRMNEDGTLANAWGKTTSGSDLFSSLPKFSKIFGLGFGNLNMTFLSNYTNGVYYIMICTGYVGLVIMLLWLFSVAINTRLCGKITAAVFAALCIAARVSISSALMFFNIFCMLDDKMLETH